MIRTAFRGWRVAWLMLLLWCKGLSHYWDLGISTQPLTSGNDRQTEKGEKGEKKRDMWDREGGWKRWGGVAEWGRNGREKWKWWKKEWEGDRREGGGGGIKGRVERAEMKWEAELCCMDRNRKGQEAAAAARETKTRHYKRGDEGEGWNTR